MKSFKTEEENMMRRNIELNDLYWKKGLYKPNVRREDYIPIFKTTKAFHRYDTLMKHKVNNESLKNLTSEKSIIAEIMKSSLYRNSFAKDPKRQNLHENIQKANIAEFVQELNNDYKDIDFILSPCKRVKSRIVIRSNGTIVNTIGDDRNSYTEAKPFDFLLQVKSGKKTYNIYIISKYTHESGGTQDDALRQIQTTHKYCQFNTDNDTFFAFILDGGLWKGSVANIKTEGKCIRSTSFEFKNSVEKWIKKNRVDK